MSLIRRRPPVAAPADGWRPAGGRRTGAGARVARGALLVAAGTAALSLAGPFALRPFADVAGAAGDVTVAFVLDFSGSSPGQVVGCVSVPPSDNGYEALGAFVQQQGLPAAPTFAPSGLLCSIDAVPTSGCGQVVDGGYVYWSYFTSSGAAWHYASAGAFATVAQGDVYGWKFQNPGTGRPNDPPPATAPVYGTLCGTTPPTTAPPSPGGGGGSGSGGGGGGGAGGGGGGKGRVAAVGAGSAVPAAHPKRAGVNGAGSGSTGTTTTTAARPGATTTSTTVARASTADSSSDGGASTPDVPADPMVAASATQSTGGPGPATLIVGGLLVAALAVAAWLRWRRRPRTP
jgi:hypothetical protein